ncbi:inner kinetochore subunit Nkp1p [Monosporozyma servazzii]
MSNTTINQHEQLSNFIQRQVNTIVESTTPDATGQNDIPTEVLTALNNKLTKLRSQNITQVAQDIITQNVFDMEHDKTLEERKQIIKLIHIRNIAKLNNKIDSQFINRDDQGSMNYYNLDYLIANIHKLPELITSETSDDTINQLKEYKVLREELINHCHAINIGETELNKLILQCNKLEALKHAMIESSGITDMGQYIQKYNEKVVKELEELIYNLENRVKSLDPEDIVEIRTLQRILKDMK